MASPISARRSRDPPLRPPDRSRMTARTTNLSTLSGGFVAVCFLVASLLFLTAEPVIAASNPTVTVNRFNHLPSKLAYFDDSSVVMYHDGTEGNVYRSEDEGKSWKLVDGPQQGKAYMLVDHPYDIRQAYILSNGKTHWRTTNKGLSWQAFTTPEPPAVRSGAPLEFHADQKHWDWIIFTGKKCTLWTPWGGSICHDEAYYTTDAFASDVKPLIEYVMHCSWAKATKDFDVHADAMNRIFCIAWEDASSTARSTVFDDPSHLLSKRSEDDSVKFSKRGEMSNRRAAQGTTRMFQSDDFFKTKRLVEFDMGRDARSFVGLGPSRKFLVTALRDIQSSTGGNDGEEMALFVTKDGIKWNKAKFPHGHGLRENAYTIVDSTLHSLVVDVLDTDTGSLFTSDSTGTQFVKSLEGTNRNSRGIVDFEHLANIDGVGLANIKAEKDSAIRTMITFDDGSRWQPVKAPKVDASGKRVNCNVDDQEECSLHLYSVTHLHNSGRVFSSTAPGFVMGVGSIGRGLLPYEDCDTFLSTDAGKTWNMVSTDAHKYEFGDQGSVLVIVDDEDSTDHISYSFNQGKDWNKLELGIKMRAKLLNTIPDNTSLKFLLVGTQTRKEAGSKGRHVAIFIDFATLNKRKCGESDFEKWYAQSATDGSCLMGHKQWYKRRKADADCFVGNKFQDPEGKEDPCPCTDTDYECDFGFVPNSDGKCIPTIAETIPTGECSESWQKTYKGSSGYRLIPGNTCDRSRGVKKDDKVEKPCDQGQPSPGTVAHQTHEFPGLIFDHFYFPESSNILVHSSDGSIWQSSNDGYSWRELQPVGNDADPNSKVLTMALHAYDKKRGYLITGGQKVHYTTNRGVDWNWFTAPLPANGLGIPILDFHPEKSDWIIWTGSSNCVSSTSDTCQAISYYSLDNGRNWNKIDNYVRTCSWARDARLKLDPKLIMCESYKDKNGNQRTFGVNNQLQLISGGNYYKQKTKLFDNVVGFATFEEYLVVAELTESGTTLRLQVSLNGRDFSTTHFPPGMKLDNRAYTVLDSVTDSIFLHVTTHANAGSEWGTLFKSNSNGTYYAMSLEYVNRNEKGFVDFEKMLGLDGIALINVVKNPDEASVSGKKELVSRITHNDGGRWKPLTPPSRDVYRTPYPCNEVGCDLHIHGYTERDDPRATYSSPSAVGLMLAVGNVGRQLAPYKDSDTFLTRDGGFTWEEVHKDAHKWEFGDQGSIIILVNDEEPTDTVLYSLNEGLTWDSYKFGEKIRVKSIVTVPEDTHRKFILFGASPRSQTKSMAVHLDFSALEKRKCTLDPSHPEQHDFELWSPSEERIEPCLFGRQTYYYRRKRQADCYIGTKVVQPHSIAKNCTCTKDDFECEFNHYRDPATGDCILYPGVSALATDEYGQCYSSNWEETEGYWYDRTNYRKVPYSSCVGGERLDRGTRHICSNNPRRHGFFWWATIVVSPFALAGFVGWWWNKKQQRRGYGG
ncbi:Oligoxyloglucan reducing end-specific cellobiohydrolase [Violaceomyces palustris]|uniref:Oligoxyloglucan reducing end-specific cellobiohydrolase n=1 Tax=Violaceomyces palustris TaxID=1673888 RepID=A0ACD0P5I5_9BASI|nr:Oligoxyloglucan reducing end-specific cellobiohydrolase [Violaceomyces palustris]